MEDKTLIAQIKTLKQIKPNRDWVVSAKCQVLGREALDRKFSIIEIFKGFVFENKLAAASILIVGMMTGTVGAAQSSLPGQVLYPVKKVTERGIALVSGSDGTPGGNLALAAKRLEEINQITQKNLAKNLPAALVEYKNAKLVAKKEVASMVQKNPQKAREIVKQMGSTMKEIGSEEKRVLAVIGLSAEATSTPDDGSDSPDKVVAASLITDYNQGALNDEQYANLMQVKELYDAGKYSEALDFYLNSPLNK